MCTVLGFKNKTQQHTIPNDDLITVCIITSTSTINLHHLQSYDLKAQWTLLHLTLFRYTEAENKRSVHKKTQCYIKSYWIKLKHVVKKHCILPLSPVTLCFNNQAGCTHVMHGGLSNFNTIRQFMVQSHSESFDMAQTIFFSEDPNSQMDLGVTWLSQAVPNLRQPNHRHFNSLFK